VDRTTRYPSPTHQNPQPPAQLPFLRRITVKPSSDLQNQPISLCLNMDGVMNTYGEMEENS
jgi:hypothetical protein